MKIIEFKNLIEVLPEKQQSFTVKKKNWEKYFDEPFGYLLSTLFPHDEIEISRNDIFKNAKDLDNLIPMTILWGYPSGMRGYSFEQIMGNYSVLKDLLLKVREKKLSWNEQTSLVAELPGLGLSTYSKLLFFLGAEPNGLPAVILDQRIIEAIRKGVFDEFEHIRKITYEKGWRLYPEYLKIIQNIATNNNLDPGKIELFLFQFGQNLKTISQE